MVERHNGYLGGSFMAGRKFAGALTASRQRMPATVSRPNSASCAAISCSSSTRSATSRSTPTPPICSSNSWPTATSSARSWWPRTCPSAGGPVLLGESMAVHILARAGAPFRDLPERHVRILSDLNCRSRCRTTQRTASEIARLHPLERRAGPSRRTDKVCRPRRAHRRYSADLLLLVRARDVDPV